MNEAGPFSDNRAKLIYTAIVFIINDYINLNFKITRKEYL